MPKPFDSCERCGCYYAFRDMTDECCWVTEGKYCVFPMPCEGEGRVRTGYEGLSITPVVREAVFEQMSKPAPRTDCDADVARHGESKPMAKQQRTNSPASDTSSGYSRCVVRALKRRAQGEEPARQVHENIQMLRKRGRGRRVSRH